MSEVIKLKKKSPLIKTLQWIGVATVSLLLIAYFVFSDSLGGGGGESILIGKVNGKPIYYTRDSDFARNYQQMVESMQSFENLGGTFEGFVEYQAFLQTVNNILLHNEAKKNILVSDNAIIDNIRGLFFMETNGTFNQAAYEEFIKSENNSDKIKLERDIKKNIEIEMLRYELFQVPKTSSFDIAFEYVKDNTKRSVEMVYANASSIVRSRIPTEAQLKTFFEANTTNFVQANVSWIVVQSGTTAGNIYNTLKDDTSMFSEKAKEASEDPTTKAQGGDIGYLVIDEFPSREISDAVFSIEKDNTLIEPMFFDDKYYIILVKNIRVPNSVAQFSKEALLSEYNKIEMPNLIEAEKSKIKTAILSDYESMQSVDELKDKGYEYYISEEFSYAENAMDIESSAVLPGSYEDIFVREVFTTSVGEVSGIIDLPNGIAIIKVLGESTKSIEEFNALTDQERNAFIAEIKNSKIQRLGNLWGQIAYENARVEYKLDQNK